MSDKTMKTNITQRSSCARKESAVGTQCFMTYTTKRQHCNLIFVTPPNPSCWSDRHSYQSARGCVLCCDTSPLNQFNGDEKWIYMLFLSISLFHVRRAMTSMQSVSVNYKTAVRNNDEFILSCEARGSPNMVFRWYKNGIYVNQTKATR